MWEQVIVMAVLRKLTDVKRCVLSFIISLLICPVAQAQGNNLLETKYFQFYTSSALNLHLFLYQHSAEIKTLKLPADSLRFYFNSKNIPDKDNSYGQLITAMNYYRDSVITKDLLFDSTMRKFSVMLSTNNQTGATGWQMHALEHIKTLQPFFNKGLWPSMDSTHKAWLNQIRNDLVQYEETITNRLQKLYGCSMPKQKIRIDLAGYASWAGAYSYSQGMDHIIISTAERSNQGQLGLEIIFHEGSHFLIDKVFDLLAQYFKTGKKPDIRRQTWHNLLFYTTGWVVADVYAGQKISFVPYYKMAKFEERVPFKLSIDAFVLYWDRYMRGEIAMEEALKKIVEYIEANEK